MKRYLLTFLALVLTMGALPAGAGESLAFTFDGAGWGHGVGFSQWGARGQALEDPTKLGEDIASYYYPGSEPGALSGLDLENELLDTLDTPIWVNLETEVQILEFTAIGGPLELCLSGEGDCPRPATPQEGETWEYRRIAVGECGFFKSGVQQGSSGDCRASITWPDADGVRLRDLTHSARICATSGSSVCEYRHGEIRLRDDPVEVGFHVVLAIGLDDYIKGVRELPDDWTSVGVNEAQAVAARTYGAYKFFANEDSSKRNQGDLNADPGLSDNRKDDCWCHLYDDTADMQYVAWDKEIDAPHWVTAVTATTDRVITYFGTSSSSYTQAGIVQAFFSASSGGWTNTNVLGFGTRWNGVDPGNSQWPYLTTVADPWANDSQWGNPNASWSESVSAPTIASLLGWDAVSAATLTEGPPEPTIQFDGTDDGSPVSTTVAGRWIRVTLGLQSSMVTAIDGEAIAHLEDTYVFTGSGWGHSIGLSQYGAYGQALEGATAAEIVDHYYEGVSVTTVDELVIAETIDAGHPVAADDSPVWVGIRQGIDAIEIRPVSGVFELCQTLEEVVTCVDLGWTDDAPETWSVVQHSFEEVSGCTARRVAPSPEEGEESPLGFGSCEISISYGGEGQTSRVALDGAACPDTGTAGRECFGRGQVHIRSAEVSSGFHVAVEIGVKEYLYGLGEMPSSWPTAALEAQALAGRSYLVRRVLTHETATPDASGPGLSSYRKATCWCHLYSTSYDQNYVGHAKESDPIYSQEWIDAVDETEGVVITHPDAVPATVILAFYHSSSGGSTETNETVWGTAALPYLVAVDDAWSNSEAVNNPYAEWTVEISSGELANQLDWDAVTHVTQLNGAPDVVFEITGLVGEVVITEVRTAGWMYYALGARSPHFNAVDVQRFEPFLDMSSSSHYEGIYAVWEAGISRGCGDDYYCPGKVVTRAQMATFLVRALGLEPVEEGPFSDIDHAGVHIGSINAVAAAGISVGCSAGLFCPDEPVNRAQMATFLARASDLEPLTEGPFADIDGMGPHVGSINAVAAAGISLGCSEGMYCPLNDVNRAQMASFLARTFVWVPDEL